MASTFEENEVRLLNKTLSIREQIIDNLLKTDLPTKARDIDAFTNLLESVDRSIHNKAKIKIEDANAKTNEETKDLLRDILLDLHKNNNTNTLAVSEREIPEFQSTGASIYEGELIHKTDVIDVKAVLEKSNQ